MNLIFCMAGLYRRFLDAGYRTQKYLLPWGQDVVLQRVMAPLVSGCNGEIVLVANLRDTKARDAILAVMAGFGIPARNLCFVPDTQGQAQTAALGCDHLEKITPLSNRRVLMHNVDTVVEGRDLANIDAILTRDHGWIDTFSASSPAYSYVAMDDAGIVTAIAEKRVISPHATTGLYGFGSIDLFRGYLGRAQRAGAEFYISDVYRAMIEDGQRVRAGVPEPGMRTVILGTPDEYRSAVGIL